MRMKPTWVSELNRIPASVTVQVDTALVADRVSREEPVSHRVVFPVSHQNPGEPPNRCAYRVARSLVVRPATELPAEADHLRTRRQLDRVQRLNDSIAFLVSP